MMRTSHAHLSGAIGALGLLLVGIVPRAGAQAGVDFPGAVTHSNAVAVSQVPSMPGYRQTVTDPDFNTKITRITGDTGTPIPGLGGATWEKNNRAAYQTHQAWSADASIIFLEFSGLFIDGNTYQVMHDTSPPGGLPYWSPVEPDIMFSVGGNKVYRFNALTQSATTWVTFAGYTDLVGHVKNNPSVDGRVLAVKAKRLSDSEQVCLVIDLEQKKKIVDVDFASVGLLTAGNDTQRCRTSPSGKYVAVEGETGGAYQAHHHDMSGKLILSTPNGGWVHCPGHQDFAVDHNGDDVDVGVCKNGPLAWELVTLRIKDGLLRSVGPGNIGGVYAASHTSGRATARPGWAYAGGYDSLDSEIRAYRLDGKRIERLSHVFSTTGDYFAQTQPLPSPDGRKILFGTNWNGEAGGAYHSFVADVSGQAPPATPPLDGGQVPDSAPLDAGPPQDSTPPPQDSTPQDSALPQQDSAPPPQDSASPPQDSAAPQDGSPSQVDSAPAPADGGPPPRDGGPGEVRMDRGPGVVATPGADAGGQLDGGSGCHLGDGDGTGDGGLRLLLLVLALIGARLGGGFRPRGVSRDPRG